MAMELCGRAATPDRTGDGDSDYSVIRTETKANTPIWRTNSGDHRRDIRACHHDLMRSVFDRTVRLGRAVVAAKADVLHGNSEAWLEAECEVPVRRAQEAAQIARFWDSLPEEKRGDPRFQSVNAVLKAMRGDKPSKPQPVVIDLQPDPVPFDLATMPREAMTLVELAKVHESHPQVAAKLLEAARILRDSLLAGAPTDASQQPSKPRPLAVQIKRHISTDPEQRERRLSQLPASELALAKRLNPSLSSRREVVP
ncbi:MAG TPA: hypothetical protein VHL31_11325 [Geminicoccus sp.]|jgi:hypothetical protein|uniref:hypothetical protein n=1 Tax=Geminicoccus sp. TaxID=2024832 RepID=UPI002E345C39|nr:hypothetical protein [Geminicoccus sp.]HEX2526871.1 hypothetical protein [Geminicoccus sp.]